MASFTLGQSEQVEFDVIPENTVLEAVIDEVEVKDSPWDVDENDPSKGKKQQVSFKFRVTEAGDWEKRVLWGNTPTTFSTHPDCKLRVWVQEILAMDDLGADFTFDTDHLVGQAVKVVVGNRPKKNVDGSTTMKDYADGVIRAATTSFAEEVF